ncbi:MAG: hypothetical protein HUU60_11630 [Armatimonadetes bacterium]|nr:hypothetical protein [Armatimonadota bacterium]
MYYEVHSPDKPGFGKSGEPVALLHGAFMTITNNWDAPNGPNWIGELAKTRKVIAVEMKSHSRTADVPRDFTYADLADDVAVLLDALKIPRIVGDTGSSPVPPTTIMDLAPHEEPLKSDSIVS